MANKKERGHKNYKYLANFTKEEVTKLRKLFGVQSNEELNECIRLIREDKKSKQSSLASSGQLTQASPSSNGYTVNQSAAPKDQETLDYEYINQYANDKDKVSAIKIAVRRTLGWEYNLERDLITDIENKSGNDPRGRKPFALKYSSILNINDKDKLERNIQQVIDSLSDKSFISQFPIASAGGKQIVEVLENYKSGNLSKADAINQLNTIEESEQSYKTRARLARQLYKGGCDYAIDLRKIPDLRYLLPIGNASNRKSINLLDEKERKAQKQNFPDNPPPQYKDSLYDKIVSTLESRRNELQHEYATPPTQIIAFYDKVIAAYKSKDWKKISQLNNEVQTMDDIAAAYDIRHNTGFPYTPDFYINDKTIEIKQLGDRKQPEPEPNPNPNPVNIETVRKRSWHSDANAFLLDTMKLQVLKEMGKIDDNIYSEGLKSPAHAIEILESKLSLNAKEQELFESGMITLMINNQEYFALMPPSVLVEKYKYVSALIGQKLAKNKNANVSNESSVIRKLYSRMEQLNTDLYKGNNLHYFDITNVSDTYEGYNEMFGIIAQEGSDQQKQMLSANRKKVKEGIDEYDKHWDIDGLTTNDADVLSQRFDQVVANIENIKLDEETLNIAKHFTFLNEQGQKEEQFDANGNIIKGSKLDEMLRISKQFVAMESLKAEHSPAQLSEQLNERMQEVLYGFHVNNLVMQGAMKEKPDQFTNKAYREEFVKNISNMDAPKPISNITYKASVAGCINIVDGYTHRLAKKVGADKPIVEKIYMPLSDLDPRAADRFGKTKSTDKKAYRKEMLKRSLKGGVSAFLVSGAITALGTAAASDAALTATTGGLNKLAGAFIGAGLGIGMTIFQVRQWRKRQKAEGKPAGRKAFFKDRRMVMTVATTALGAAAIGFAATGNPGVAQALGYGAIAMGSANSLISSIQDAKAQGISAWEGAGWGLLQTVINIGAGMGGRYTAEAGINWANEQFPENKIFQHEETSTKTTTVQVADVNRINADAKEFLSKTWYRDDTASLNALIHKYGSAEAVLYAIDAGGIETPALAQYDNVTDHTVLTKSWATQNDVNPEYVEILRNPSAHTQTELQAAVEGIRGHVDPSHNFVTKIENAPVRSDLYPDRNPNSTYSHDFDKYMKTITNTTTTTNLVPNEVQPGIGMFGIMMNKLPLVQKIKGLKKRLGALKDLVVSEGDKRSPKDENITVKPRDEGKTDEKSKGEGKKGKGKKMVSVGVPGRPRD